MKIAAAQIKTIEHNTDANIQTHLRMIALAAQEKVELILFPEMSLTGYERALADALSFTEEDTRLAVFIEKAQRHQMHIVVGAPIKINAELYIGSFIFSPTGTTSIYTKQFLHDGEELYFSSAKTLNPIVEWKGQQISLAICADITHPIHAANAGNKGTTLYLASIFYTPKGIQDGYQLLSSYAKKYLMNILMANAIGTAYQLEGAGESAFWAKDGELVCHMNGTEENLLIVAI